MSTVYKAPWRAAGEPDSDRQLINCFTEACAFAWADARQLGQPTFDYRTGAPDVYVDPASWVEAKSIGPSDVNRKLTKYMMESGAFVTGTVPTVGPGILAKFQYSYDDAKKKFARQSTGCYVTFFNLTEVDTELVPRRAEILEQICHWARDMTNQNPSFRSS